MYKWKSLKWHFLHCIKGLYVHNFGKNTKVILQEQNTTEEFCFKGELQIILFQISRGYGMYHIKN